MTIDLNLFPSSICSLQFLLVIMYVLNFCFDLSHVYFNILVFIFLSQRTFRMEVRILSLVGLPMEALPSGT